MLGKSLMFSILPQPYLNYLLAILITSTGTTPFLNVGIIPITAVLKVHFNPLQSW